MAEYVCLLRASADMYVWLGSCCHECLVQCSQQLVWKSSLLYVSAAHPMKFMLLFSLQVARPGDRVLHGDSVKLDGKPVRWQALNPSNSSSKEKFVYLKYWKPRDVICTTDRTITGNIVDQVCSTIHTLHSLESVSIFHQPSSPPLARLQLKCIILSLLSYTSASSVSQHWFIQ